MQPLPLRAATKGLLATPKVSSPWPAKAAIPLLYLRLAISGKSAVAIKKKYTLTPPQ